MYKNLLYEERGKVAKITFNRPSSLNALNVETKKELVEAVNSVQNNPGIQCLILTGTGDRAFCAGQDLNESKIQGPDQAEEWVRSFDDMYKAIRNLDKPLIASVNGAATGSGMQLVLLADFRICSDNARFAMTEIDVGFACIIGTTLMWDILGRSKTVEMILGGGFLSAQEAKERDLVTKVVTFADLEKETYDLANMLAEKPPVATKMNKKWFKQLTEENFNKCMEFAIKAHIEGYKSGEPNEYQKRFFEIRAKRRAAKK